MSPISPCVRDIDLSVSAKDSHGIHREKQASWQFRLWEQPLHMKDNWKALIPLVLLSVLFSPAAIWSQWAIALNNYGYYTSFTPLPAQSQEHAKLER